MTLPSALVIVNPRASRIEGQVAHALAMLSQHLVVELAEAPAHSGQTERLGERMRNFDRVIVAGGDGTLHRLLPLLLQVDRPIGVLPLGTANDFARSLDMPQDLAGACELASGSQMRRVDVGVINGRPFLNVASLGLAATVTKLQTGPRKKLLFAVSYAVSLIEAFRRCRPFRATISAGDQTVFTGLVLQASIGNGRFHGGGLSSGPDARIDDGQLHIYTVAARSWWRLIAVVPALLFGLHRWTANVSSFSARSCIVTTRSPKRASVDGELFDIESRQFACSVMPKALTVLAPNANVTPLPTDFIGHGHSKHATQGAPARPERTTRLDRWVDITD